MFYDRKIRYVHAYEGEEKIQNAGFLRMEAREEKVFLELRISKLRSTDSCACPVFLLGGGKEEAFGEIYLEGGRGCLEKKDLPRDDLTGGIGYGQLEQIYIKMPGKRVLRCIISEEKEAPEKDPIEGAAIEERAVRAAGGGYETEECVSRETEGMTRAAERSAGYSCETGERVSRETEGMTQAAEQSAGYSCETGERVSRETEGMTRAAERAVGYNFETEERTGKADNRIPETADKWQYLLSAYPHIRPFEDEREYVLLKPRDLVILPEKYFGLTGNSFLLHGFCNYEHLILSKERKYGETVFYIGVPGNFYHKEKQVAVLFGFESFEGKTEPARNGDFGYYMIAVEL